MSFNQSFKGERDNLQYELEYKKIKSFLDSNRLDEGHMYITQVQELFGDDISKENQMIIDVLTCILQNRANKVQENLQQISKLDGIIENKLMLFDFTIAKADTFWKAGKQQEALIALENIEGEISRSKHELLSKFTSNLDIIEREVDIQNTKGIVKWYLGDVRNSQNAFQQAYNLASNLQNKYYIANSLNNLGNVFSYQGEILLALDYHKKSLELRKMLPNHTDIACSLANIGEMYQYLGKYDLSLEFYKQAQSIFESLDSYIFLAQLYHDLLNVYVIKNNLQEAQANLDNLKSLSSRHGENLFVHTYFLLAEGLMLKNSTSLMTKFKAADNFLQITNNPVVDSTLTAQAIFNLNELLLLEAKLSQDEHKLNEIHIWLKKLYLLANDLNSPVLLVQTYLLDSKLKLLEFKVDEARELLLTGQELANQKGIKKFENQISRELHQLLIQEDSWNNLRTKGATLEERIDLTGLESTLDNLIRKRQERPEIVELIMNNIRPPIKNLQDFYELLTHETYITIYRQFKLGPEIYISDDLRFSKTNKIILETKAGVYFMAAVGQGNNLNEGLFGPLPFPDSQDYESIIFTTFLDDIENSDPRSKGKSYCMFVVTFPKQFESYYSNRQYLIQILNTFQRKFENLQAIKAKDIVDLKLQLIK